MDAALVAPVRPVTLIVDCGSGFTRARIFYADNDGVPHSEEAGDYSGIGRWSQPALVKILQDGPPAVRTFVESLQTLQHASRSTSCIVGATGGLREAETKGQVTASMIDGFKILLEELTPKVEFKYMSSADEAAAELWAVQHVSEAGLPPSASRPIGLISGGGMTCQFAYYPKDVDKPVCMSLVVDLLSAVDVMLEVGVKRGLREFQTRFAAEVNKTGLVGQLLGTFVVIEMPGYMGDSRYPALESLNLGKRLITKAEASATLTTHIESWLQESDEVSDYHGAYIGLLPAELLALLTLLDERSQLYIAREWEIAPGQIIKPDWSLGLFVNSQRLAK